MGTFPDYFYYFHSKIERKANSPACSGEEMLEFERKEGMKESSRTVGE